MASLGRALRIRWEFLVKAMTSSKLLLVPPGLVAEWRPVAWRLLAKDQNFSSGYFNLMRIEEALAVGDLQLWMVVDDVAGEVLAAMLTENGAPPKARIAMVAEMDAAMTGAT